MDAATRSQCHFQAFVFATKMDPMMKLVYLALHHFAFGQDSTFVSQEKVALACCCSVRTVQRAIARLQAEGLLNPVQEGRLRRCYFSLPVSAGMEKRDTPPPPPSEAPAPCRRHAASVTCAAESHVTRAKGVNMTTYDNLSPVFKDLKSRSLHNPPPSSSPGESGGGGAFSLSISSLESIKADFQRLAAAYPRHEGLREAFDVYRRMYAELPLVEELLRLVEQEKAHNGKWQRDSGQWIPWLKNWLGLKQYQVVEMFLASRPEPVAAAAAMEATADEPEAADIVALEPELCAGLAQAWGKTLEGLDDQTRGSLNTFHAAYGWLPSLEEARKGRAEFPNMRLWLFHPELWTMEVA